MFFLNWIIISFRGMWICRKYLLIFSPLKTTRIYEYSESEFEYNIQKHIYVFTHVNYLAICRRKRREISRTGLPLVWSAKMVSYEFFLLHLKLISTGLLCYIFFTFLLQIPFAKDPLSFMPSFLQIIFVSGPLYCNSFLFLVLISTNPLCFMSSFLQILFV